MRPKELIERYAQTHGGPAHLREMLACLLRDGKIAVRASSRATSTERKLSIAWKRADLQPVVNGASDKAARDIKPSTWRRSVSWADDILEWDFSRSRMHVTLSLDPPRRLLLAHVRFLENDVRQAFGVATMDLPLNLKPLKNRGSWRKVYFELILLAAGGRDKVLSSPLAKFKSDESLTNCIIDIFQCDDEERKRSIEDDAALAETLEKRLPLQFGETGLNDEVIELRRYLGLVRQHVIRKTRRAR